MNDQAANLDGVNLEEVEEEIKKVKQTKPSEIKRRKNSCWNVLSSSVENFQNIVIDLEGGKVEDKLSGKLLATETEDHDRSNGAIARYP